MPDSLLGAGLAGFPGWAQPHHDSGPSFVTVQRPRLGEEVGLRVWVPDTFPVTQVAVRQVIDGETFNRVLTPAPADHGTWWTTTIVAENLLNRYRFCLAGPPGPTRYTWLTAAGIVDHDVSDSTDFTLSCHDGPPSWVTDAVVYQIFPDRFASSGRSYEVPDWAIPTPWGTTPDRAEKSFAEYFGGDLWGVLEHLDYIASLGANVIYLTPVFPARSVHRYDASRFDIVDPLLGGDEALLALVRAAHQRGIRVVCDLTTNHTGQTHTWFEAARADASCAEAEYFYFTEHPDRWVGWLGIRSLPKVNHASRALRERLYTGDASVAARWLSEPYLVDGWRIDVANMTGRLGEVDLAHQVARDLRATMARVSERTGRGTWLVAEHGHDASRDLQGEGWHGTMNYQGFTRPLWAWLSDPGNDINWLGLPMAVPHLSGRQVKQTLHGYNAELPWVARLASQNQLDSHDTARFRSVSGSDDALRVGLAALVTLPGVPTVFSGDELGHQGLSGEHSRTTIDWAGLADAEPALLGTFREWLALRHREAALREGGLRWLDWGDDYLLYARTHPSGDLLVALSRARHAEVRVPLSALLAGGGREVASVGGVRLRAEEGEIVLRAGAAGASVLRLG